MSKKNTVRAAAIGVVLMTGWTLAAGPGGSGLAVAPFEVERTGTLSDRSLREVSGMAASRRRDDILWLHNDSGSRAQLHAVSADGRAHGKVLIKGATSRDWEDMAAFELDGRPMLVVADVGDNNAERATLWLHFFEEPTVPAEGLSDDASVDVEWSVPFRFPEGPADCESIAVDTQSGQVLLLTKRQTPPQLYSLPIRPPGALPGRGKLIEATHLGSVSTIPRPRVEDLLADPIFGAYSSQPTSMDVYGDQLMILTYRDAYVYARSATGSWAETLAQKPAVVELPRMRQTESLAFDRTGKDVFVTSEKMNAPLYRLRRIAVREEAE